MAMSSAGMTAFMVMVLAVSVAGVPTLVVMIAFYVGVILECAGYVRHNCGIRIARYAASERYTLVGKCHLRTAADTAATWEVLLGQLEKHPELPREIAELAQYSDNSDPDAIDRNRRFKFNGDEAVVNFGKYSGRTLRDIAENEPGFLRWIIKSDFPDDVKNIAQNALMGKFPIRQGAGSENA